MPDTAYTVIKNKIKETLDGINKIQVTKDDPSEKFDGYPAAVIIPSPQDSERESSNRNQRFYAFKVSLFQDVQSVGLPAAMDTLYDLVDDVLNAFDQDETFSGISLPTGFTMVAIEPAVSEWLEFDDGKLLGVEITLIVRVSVSLS